jgi:DNA-binding CsgD family transcriptional regulator
MEEFLSWSLESPALSESHLRAYISRLLSHFAAVLPSQYSQPTGDMHIDPLTERELEVLRLIAQGLSNREISERLFLALSTVKGYNRIIFDKLQAKMHRSVACGPRAGPLQAHLPTLDHYFNIHTSIPACRYITCTTSKWHRLLKATKVTMLQQLKNDPNDKCLSNVIKGL